MDLGLKGLAEQLVERAAHRVALTGRRMLLFFLGGLCVLVTLGFLTAALYTWLDRSYGVFIAELGVAAIFLLLGLILMLVGAMTGRRRPSPAARSHGPAGGPRQRRHRAYRSALRAGGRLRAGLRSRPAPRQVAPPGCLRCRHP